MLAFKDPEEKWRSALRAIGLTRLARSGDRPKYLPNLHHPFYRSHDYRDVNGGRSFLGNETAKAKAQRNLDHSLSEIRDIMIGITGALDLYSYDGLKTMGGSLHMYAQECYGLERLRQYMVLVAETIEIPDVLDEGVDKEVLKAYWLKCREIEMRWPQVFAEGLSRS